MSVTLKKTVTIRFSRTLAKALDLLRCQCGHPESNHFNSPDEYPRPCAWPGCHCRNYDEVVQYGKRVDGVKG